MLLGSGLISRSDSRKQRLYSLPNVGRLTYSSDPKVEGACARDFIGTGTRLVDVPMNSIGTKNATSFGQLALLAVPSH